MLQAFQYTPCLPEKTLCLTFDDGPGDTIGNGAGPKTLRIANYLANESIRATFFVVGKFVEKFPQIVSEVKKCKHIIGNHTFTHKDKNIPQMFAEDKPNLLNEIESTTNLIKKYIENDTVYFRAPWGLWENEGNGREISDFLNNNLDSSINYVGPICWNIDVDDWKCWQNSEDAESVSDKYFDKIQLLNNGIILMHDSTADDETTMAKNKTFETIEFLIPKLIQSGYKFIGLDDAIKLL